MPRKQVPVFDKSDFLSAKKLAKVFNMDAEIIDAEMKRQFKRGTQILIPNAGRRPMIYHEKWAHSNSAGVPRTFRLHPLAMEKFYEILKKGKPHEI